MSEASSLWPFAVMAVAALVTYLFRGLGVALAGKLDTANPLFEWTACVAYALLAGLIARMVLFPIGPLEATALGDRLGALGFAVAAFLLTHKNVAWGVAAGAVGLILLTLGSF